jgi:type I restriction enzyme S subunit
MNGVFKKPEQAGSGTKLINVFDLYADTVVDLSLVDRVNIDAKEVEKYRVMPGDIFFTRSSLKPAGVAWSAYLEDGPVEEAVFECHVIRARVDRQRAIPGYISNYARTELARSYLTSRAGVTTMATIDQPGISELPVILPEPQIQHRLLDALDSARATWRVKLSRAASLLAAIDSFVLEALGLDLSTTKQQRVYAVKLEEVRNRFDPDYSSPKFRALRAGIESAKHDARSVGSLFDPIVSGFAAGGDDQTDDLSAGIPHLRPLNITNTAELQINNTKRVPRSQVSPEDLLRRGEVLFNNTNSTAWVGKSVVFDLEQECACSNHITRLSLLDPRNNPYFFAAFFNSLRSVGFFGMLATNFNNQAGINVETLKRVRVPVPDPEVQNEIAIEISRRRGEARRLGNEADILWENAKAEFEEELLGSDSKDRTIKRSSAIRRIRS